MNVTYQELTEAVIKIYKSALAIFEKVFGFNVRVPVALMFLILGASGVAVSQDLKHVDFKNYTYPWGGPPNWSDQLEWLDLSEPSTVRLSDGRWADPAQAEEHSKYNLPFAGLTLESVTMGDVTGEGQDNAIVVLRYDTGGTQFLYFVYVYTFADGRPKPLAYFHAGDRSDSGLYQVYGQNKELVVELYDPSKRTGDCCSSGFIRTRYRWHGGKFEITGKNEFGTPRTASRLPVSPFGIHQ